MQILNWCMPLVIGWISLHSILGDINILFCNISNYFVMFYHFILRCIRTHALSRELDWKNLQGPFQFCDSMILFFYFTVWWLCIQTAWNNFWQSPFFLSASITFKLWMEVSGCIVFVLFPSNWSFLDIFLLLDKFASECFCIANVFEQYNQIPLASYTYIVQR